MLELGLHCSFPECMYIMQCDLYTIVKKFVFKLCEA